MLTYLWLNAHSAFMDKFVCMRNVRLKIKYNANIFWYLSNYFVSVVFPIKLSDCFLNLSLHFCRSKADIFSLRVTESWLYACTRVKKIRGRQFDWIIFCDRSNQGWPCFVLWRGEEYSRILAWCVFSPGARCLLSAHCFTNPVQSAAQTSHNNTA